MYRIVRAKKDATIYSDEPCRNTGLDEILELLTFSDKLPESPVCDDTFVDRDNPFEFLQNYNIKKLYLEYGPKYQLKRDYGLQDTSSTAVPYRILVDPKESGSITFEEAQDVTDQVIDMFYPKLQRFNEEFGDIRAQKSRVLMFFDLDEIIEEAREFSDVDSGETQIEYETFLRLYSTESAELPIQYDLEVYPLKSQFSYFLSYNSIEGWRTGLGRKFNDIDVGVSWIFRDLGENDRWERPGGGFYETHPEDDVFDEVRSVQRFDFGDPDVYMNMTDTFNFWVEDETYVNEGIILKRSDVNEAQKGGTYQAIENFGAATELRFFGTRTHTIFAPEILFGFDDHEWYTVSGEMITFSNDVNIKTTDLKSIYSSSERPRIRAVVQERYPEKIYLDNEDAVNRRRTPKFLPEGSVTYSIIDEVANKRIIPFSEYSQLSFDPEGYYFDLDLNNFYPERVYEIEFKYEDPFDGSTKIFRNNQKFKLRD